MVADEFAKIMHTFEFCRVRYVLKPTMTPAVRTLPITIQLNTQWSTIHLNTTRRASGGGD